MHLVRKNNQPSQLPVDGRIKQLVERLRKLEQENQILKTIIYEYESGQVDPTQK